jgi:purine-binding chemotaxis protein CheW
MAGNSASDKVDYEALHRRLDEAQAEHESSQVLSPQRRREVLLERARALAESRHEERRETISVLAFRVGGERYAVPIEAVDHVLESRGMCLLPGAPRHVLGALVSRSRVVSVLDLRQVLGLEGGGMTDLTRVVVVEAAEECFGLAAEEVEGRLELPLAELSPAPPGPFTHLTRERLMVLDLEQFGEPALARRG